MLSMLRNRKQFLSGIQHTMKFVHISSEYNYFKMHLCWNRTLDKSLMDFFTIGVWAGAHKVACVLWH